MIGEISRKLDILLSPLGFIEDIVWCQLSLKYCMYWRCCWSSCKLPPGDSDVISPHFTGVMQVRYSQSTSAGNRRNSVSLSWDENWDTIIGRLFGSNSEWFEARRTLHAISWVASLSAVYGDSRIIYQELHNLFPESTKSDYGPIFITTANGV